MHAFGALRGAPVAVDDQYLVRRATAIAVDDSHKEEHQDDGAYQKEIEWFHDLIVLGLVFFCCSLGCV